MLRGQSDKHLLNLEDSQSHWYIKVGQVTQIYALLERGPLATGDYDKVAQELREYPKIRCPILAVWGDHDEYLPPIRSAAFLEECLGKAGHEDTTLRVVPGASHILTAPGSGHRFVEGYPGLLTDWIRQRF